MRESFFNEQIRQYFEEDKLAEAAVYCAAILPQIRDTCGEGIQDVAHVLNNIARAYYYLGDYSAAPEATKTLVKIGCARKGATSG